MLRKYLHIYYLHQFEVIQYRLLHEYGAKSSFENLNVFKACWISTADEKNANYKDFLRVKQKFLAKDKRNQLVFFADSSFSLQMTQQKYPEITFHFTSEFWFNKIFDGIYLRVSRKNTIKLSLSNTNQKSFNVSIAYSALIRKIKIKPIAKI